MRIIDDRAETIKKRVEGKGVGSDHRTLGTVAIGLILRRYHSHLVVVVLNEYYLGVVLSQIHMVEATLHKPIELHRLSCCLKVGYESGIGNKVATT